MGKQASTGISWCDYSFNPWIGCKKVSPACANCYATRTVNRFGGDFHGRRVLTSDSNWKNPLRWNREAEKLGTRFRVFCASWADVFEDWDGPIFCSGGIHELSICSGCGEFIRYTGHCSGNNLLCQMIPRPLRMIDVRKRLFKLIDSTPNLDWQLLTKRPENIRRMWPCWPTGFPEDGSGGHGSGARYLKNTWLGVTVENQEQAYKRIPELLQCRDLSPVLFLSCEPLLGPIDLCRAHLTDFKLPNWPEPSRVDWVICGGESGPGARPSNPDWFRSIRDQCESAGVPFHFKQWGEFDEHQNRVGKKKAGRLLDGRTYDAFPGPKP